jgi:hypothetical protein
MRAGSGLDWLIAPAAAEPVAPTLGLAEREVNRDANSQALQEGQAWYVRLIAEEPTVSMQTRNSVLGQLPDSLDDYDAHDLPKMAPFGQPYLSIAFPHPDWGKNADDYASDYRPNYSSGGGAHTTADRPPRPAGLPPASWPFEIRTDRAGYAIKLRWEGPPDLLGRMELVDNDTGARYPSGNPGYVRNGIQMKMTTPVRHFTWVFAGQPSP